MKATEIFEQWLEQGYKISFWGSSIYSLNKIDIVVDTVKRKYANINWGCIYDANSQNDYVTISGIKFEIANGNLYNAKDEKLILCATKKRSFHEIASRIERENSIYQKDYLDMDELFLHGTKVHPYERIQPNATYAPWRKDEEFTCIFEKVKNNTLIDIYRLYSLWVACKETAKCKEGDIAEIGVWRGGSGGVLSRGAYIFSKTKSEKVYLCDTFQGVPKTGAEDTCYTGGEHCDTNLEIVEELLKNCQAKNIEIVTGIFPDDCYEKFTDKIFRLVHIDVDVYQSAKDVFNFVWSKMVLGGMVIFDDYGFISTVGVTTLCNELENQITDGRCIFHLNGQAIFVKCG